MKSQFSRMARRTFLATTAGATTFTLLKPGSVFGAPANSQIELGLIGCGGRGSWIANLFAQSGKYRLASCADYFKDRTDALTVKHKLEPDRCFNGLSGYKRLLDSKVDAVVIETPPYFHPQQAADAVAAGKHVFLAKPIAVDAPGCLTIAEAGRSATKRKQVFVVDFQTRANEHFRAAMAQVHQGAIGKLIMVEAFYPWSSGGRGAPARTPAEQLRSWYYTLPLSGDFIVEQSIHSLDIATWIINADPLSARGFGGHKVRPRDSIFDHFAIQYRFPNDLTLSFTCIQTVPMIKDEIRARAYGSDGFIDVDYFGGVLLRNKDHIIQANMEDLYTSGTVVNINEFHQAIVAGDFSNPTVVPSVRSNLTAVLGREAVYNQGELALADLVKQATRLEPNLAGLET